METQTVWGIWARYEGEDEWRWCYGTAGGGLVFYESEEQARTRAVRWLKNSPGELAETVVKCIELPVPKGVTA